MDNRGISAIVATVLTILITVAGIVIIWVAIVPMIQENIAFSELDGRVSVVTSGGYTSYDADRGIATVQIKRDVDEGVMDNIRILFIINGTSSSSVVVAPESGSSRVYNFVLDDEPDSVSVAPIFVSGRSEKEGVVTSEVEISSGTITEVGDTVYLLDKDYSSGEDVQITGLINWWKFDGNFDDSIGNDDGIAQGDVQIVGDVAVFDGTGDYVDLPGYDGTDGLQEVSVSLWAKFDEDNFTTLRPLLCIGDGGNRIPWIWGNTASNEIRMQYASGVPSQMMTPPVTKNIWYHVVFTQDDVNAFLYLDGSEADTVSAVDTTSLTSGGAGFIGKFEVTPTNPTNSFMMMGEIDEVMIFDKALSQEEVTSIYESQINLHNI